ncbi:hypothetical protein AAEH77_11960 [Shewanella xiamenensis]|uniref:phosphoribosyltransferase-like protein n=1 Tax=Shewanella xiamenensis TaxID=332186 RepID=UPI00313D3E19
MILPNNSDEIFERVIQKSMTLIKLKYWDDIEKTQLNKWLNNFKTPEEKYLAAVILSKLMYRSKESIRAFGSHLFHIILPQLLEEIGIYKIQSLNDWEKILKMENSRCLPIRFSTIEGVDNQPGKSGSAVFRQIRKKYFNKSLGINCLNLHETPAHVKAIIFFDDIIGTGEQFCEFLEKYNIKQLDKKIIFCPFAAQEVGLKKIKAEYPDIIISPVEILDESSGLFSQHNKMLNQEHVEFKEFYLKTCQKYSIKTSMKLGHGELALTYCFNDSSPNNNIAALWYQGESWNSLIQR